MIDWRLRDVNVGLSGRKNVLRKLLRIPYRLRLFVSFCESSDWDWMKYTRCESLLLLKAFFLFLLLLLLFFRHLKITLDSEQPMLKTDHLSVWGGIKQFEHFQRGLYFSDNRPLALRGHVTNTSLKRLVGILLMPKIDRAHKNYLTCEIWEKKPFKGDILWHFDFSTK